MRSRLALAVSMVVVTALLAGACGSGEPNEPTEPSGPKEFAPSAVPSIEVPPDVLAAYPNAADVYEMATQYAFDLVGPAVSKRRTEVVPADFDAVLPLLTPSHRTEVEELVGCSAEDGCWTDLVGIRLYGITEYMEQYQAPWQLNQTADPIGVNKKISDPSVEIDEETGYLLVTFGYRFDLLAENPDGDEKKWSFENDMKLWYVMSESGEMLINETEFLLQPGDLTGDGESEGDEAG